MEKSQLRKLLFGVALIFTLLVTFGGVQQKIYFDIASSHAIASRQNALVEVKATCAMQPSPDRCRTGALRAARAEQREEYDLYSQRTMALWTAIMGIMAITGAALSAIGIYLIWRTWDATREAAESSRKTLRSYIARERGVLQLERCLFSYEDTRFHPTGFYVRTKNIGLSIATIVSVEWQILEGPIWPTRLRMQTYDHVVIVPGEGDYTCFLEWDEPNRDQEKRWFVGCIHYTTLENEQYATYFSYEIEYISSSLTGEGRWSPVETVVAGTPRDT